MIGIIQFQSEPLKLAGGLLFLQEQGKGLWMKVAFAFLEDRIVPVFDTAQRVLLAEVDSAMIRSETIVRLTAQEPMERLKALSNLRVDVLVCGAISAELQQFLAAQGVRVIPFVAGDLKDVKAAWLQGSLERGEHRMPGCRRRGGIHKEGNSMNKQGRGRGGGSGQGGGSSGRGRGCGSGQSSGMGQGAVPGSGQSGPAASAREMDVCLCPKCGHHEPHGQGMPCNHKLCPKCGTAMTREYPQF
jgi:predicted Fe-Mo cluster-binding NifX family protein